MDNRIFSYVRGSEAPVRIATIKFDFAESPVEFMRLAMQQVEGSVVYRHYINSMSKNINEPSEMQVVRMSLNSILYPYLYSVLFEPPNAHSAGVQALAASKRRLHKVYEDNQLDRHIPMLVDYRAVRQGSTVLEVVLYLCTAVAAYGGFRSGVKQILKDIQVGSKLISAVLPNRRNDYSPPRIEPTLDLPTQPDASLSHISQHDFARILMQSEHNFLKGNEGSEGIGDHFGGSLGRNFDVLGTSGIHEDFDLKLLTNAMKNKK